MIRAVSGTGKAVRARLPLPTLLLAVAALANTGEARASEAQVIWLGEEGIVAAVAENNIQLYGSMTATGPYAQAGLTAFQRQQTTGMPTPNETGGGTGDDMMIEPNWGVAEVLFRCHAADVVISQFVDGQTVEILATTVPIDQC